MAYLLLLLLLILPALACERTSISGTPGGDNVLVSEDFNDPAAHTWDIFTGDPAMSARNDQGRMLLAVNTSDELTWSVLEDANAAYDDFALEIDATPIDGPTDNSYGVVFRYSDRFNFYSFDISSDGWYRLRVRQGTGAGDVQWRKLIDWTQSPLIRGGIAQGNRLGVVAQGEQFTLLVNGQTLAQTSDKTFARGRVGVIAGSYEQVGVQVAFDNLLVKKP
jgi:hypothetical protein